jgi:hypothetical protein
LPNLTTWQLRTCPLVSSRTRSRPLLRTSNAGTCRWLELVAELDRRGGLSGCSTAEWLAWRCALSPRAAREHVRVARRLAELPMIHEAFACGELSYAKVRALTRVAEPENDEELLELARCMTASQLERAVRAIGR